MGPRGRSSQGRIAAVSVFLAMSGFSNHQSNDILVVFWHAFGCFSGVFGSFSVAFGLVFGRFRVGTGTTVFAAPVLFFFLGDQNAVPGPTWRHRDDRNAVPLPMLVDVSQHVSQC